MRRHLVLCVCLLLSSFGIAFGSCTSPQNPVEAENCLQGTTGWTVPGTGDATIQGFATDISVNAGQTISFKISTPASSYHVDIYRIGYYGGAGGRYITTIQPSAHLPQTQPACLTDTNTGLYDCGNWGVSASWTVPSTAVSGLYIAAPVRNDTGGASQMWFVVRNDNSHSVILFQTSDESWEAYNGYGGHSFYGPATGFDLNNRGYKVSYNRPFAWIEDQTQPLYAEYPMIRWLEANGYDVSYFTSVDAARSGNLIQNHQVYLSVGHDEYWSGPKRASIESARAAGVNLAFFSGNEAFWKTRWENSIDGSNTTYRTLVCYKETLGPNSNPSATAAVDPLDPPTWTGTWRDPIKSPPADGGRPENALTGTLFEVNGPGTDNTDLKIQVPAAFGQLRFWRNTSIATQSPGQTATLIPGSLGYEWDIDADNGYRPAGLFDLSTSTYNLTTDYLLDFGGLYGAGTATHKLTMYRYYNNVGQPNQTPLGLVFGAGTIQWPWGLDANHDGSTEPVDVRMQQATVNLFADMGAQPATLQPGLVLAAKSSDTQPPVSTITSPAEESTVQFGMPVTITGTAVDNGGGVVAGVEVSIDGGQTWHAATGTGNWSYNWIPRFSGAISLLSRAVDDSGNLAIPSGVTVNVPKLPLSLDVQVSADGFSSSTSIKSPIFSTSAGNELLLAFVATDYLTGANTTVTSMVGGGITWTLAARSNAQSGTSEIWKAFAASPISGASVTATFSQSALSSITIMSFTGVDTSGTGGSGAIGATAVKGASTGAPSVSLTSTRNYSWIFGVGNDYDSAIARTPGTGQSLVHQLLTGTGDTYWVQMQNSPTIQSGTVVTINDTAPTSDRWNLASVEVLPAVGGILSITGAVLPQSAGAGVTLTLSGAASTTTTTDANGNYTFVGLASGAYTVTPSKSGYGFTPASQQVTLSGTNVTGVNFTGSVQNFTISGNLSPIGANASVSLAGAATATTTADGSGNYSFGGLINGSYIVTPTKSGTAFSPNSQSVTISGGDVSGINFSASLQNLSISGTLSPTGATATVSLSGTTTATVTADASGNYSFANLGNGSYTITPSKNGYVFNPVSQNVTLAGTSITGVNFTAQLVTTAGLGIDAKVSADGPSASSAISSPAFSTAGNNELLLVFVSSDYLSGTNTSVTSMTGGGLAWAPVIRANQQSGDSEIWRAFAPAPLTNVSVTANLSQSIVSSITVMSYTGVDTTGTNGSGAIGAAVSKSAATGAPSVSVATTRNNSWVFGVGNDFDNAVARAASSGQTVVHQDLTSAGDTYWVQMQNGTTALSGSTVAISDTAPTSDRWNLAAVEVLPSLGSYSISGTVTPAITGATMSLSGAMSATATPDGFGNYAFLGLSNGAYTVTPSKAGFNFSPAFQNVTVSGANVPAINFTAAAQTFSISGNVSVTGANAIVTLSGSGTGSTIADASGNYTFTGLLNGSYTVTPSKSGVTFNPLSQNATVNGSNVSGVNFTAAQTFSVSGSVSATGANATVTLSGSGTGSTTADASGNYTFTGLLNGSYTVTPSKPGVTFSPSSQNVTVNGSNVSGVSFTATGQTFSISGSVSVTGANATVTLSGSGTGSTTADASGNYTFAGLLNGTYTVTPSKPGVIFNPASQSVTVNDSNVSAVNFTAAQTFSVSGSVSAAGANATVTLSGSGTGSRTADASGNYTFAGLLNGTYTVTPSKSGVTFSPASQNVTVSGANVSGVNFTAAGTGASLAIDTNTSKDGTTASTTIATQAFSTTSGNELLLAFVATDYLSGSNTTVSSITGGGLTWNLVKRTNVQSGDAEVWAAFAPSALTNVTVTATVSQKVVCSITVLSFTGVDTTLGATLPNSVGATATGNARTGAPSASVVTTRNNSWVFGVGSDYDNAVARSPGTGQTVVHQFLTPTGDTYWVQMQNATTPLSGTSVSINDVAPTADRYNLTLVEVRTP